MAPRRLPTAPHAPLVAFTLDGLEIEAREGEPVAVALLVAGRRILSRSFRFHRPRGLMCSTGSCGWCECEVDGRPSVKTCQVPVRAGMVVRGEHAFPSVGFDVLGLLGLVARLIPPTFYHHRFLRPRSLRQRYLGVIRWFGGRGRLRTQGDARTAPVGRPVERVDVDILVVGAGPGGRLAAAGAAGTGARVALLDRGDVDPTGLDGVMVSERTTAVGLYDRVLLAVAHAAQLEIRAGAIVIATGSTERVPAVRGIDLPGVMGARAVERLLVDHHVLAGERAVLIGTAGDCEAIGHALEAAGTHLVGKVVAWDLAEVTGRRSVTGVRRTDGRLHRADLVVICERTPALDLARAAGITTAWRAGRLVPMTSDGATSVPWAWLAGSAMGDGPSVHDPVRHREVGRRAARAVLGGRSGARTERDPDPIAPYDPPPSTTDWHPRALVCFCEDVYVDELHREARVADGEIELLKRRTGALTGPCQGTYCLAGVVACAAGVNRDPRPGLATARPPLRGIRLGELVADDPPAADAS